MHLDMRGHYYGRLLKIEAHIQRLRRSEKGESEEPAR